MTRVLVKHEFIRALKRLRALQQLRGVVIAQPADVEALLAMPCLSSLTSLALTFVQGRVSGDGVRRILEEPRLARLEALTAGFDGVSEEVAAVAVRLLPWRTSLTASSTTHFLDLLKVASSLPLGTPTSPLTSRRQR